MEVRLIDQKDIDKNKWNSCVHFAHNGNIFGYHWYLNNVVKEWHGLVEGEYESVLPLIYQPKSLFRKARLYTHGLLRSTGIYSVNVLSEKRIRTFLEAIPDDYPKWQIAFNEGMSLPSAFQNKRVIQKKNALLLLKIPYEEIAAEYSPALVQILEKASLANLIVVNNITPEKLVAFYRKHAKGNWSESNFHAYQRVMYNAMHRGWGLFSGIQNQKGELLAANFFTISNQRFMSLLPVVSPEGKKVGALELLFDMSIRMQAGRPVVLDFNVEEPGSFELGFGAVASPFFVGANK